MKITKNKKEVLKNAKKTSKDLLPSKKSFKQKQKEALELFSDMVFIESKRNLYKFTKEELLEDFTWIDSQDTESAGCNCFLSSGFEIDVLGKLIIV